MHKFWLFLIAIPVSAQLTTGSISGYVLDPGNKPVPHAAIMTTELGRGVERRTTADETGFYVIADLEPARYSIAATATGFQPSNAQRITVTVDSRSRLDILLSISPTRQSIDVAESASLVNTESAELGAVLDQRLIDGLPLNRRDFLQLSLLTPGVLPPVQASELSSRGGFAMHANGAREEFNHFLLDGVDNNDPYENTYVLQPSVDTIQEFKIVTNGYSAEYGRNAGAQVNVVTRSGGGEWHGGAWEYLRNRDLDARNFFDGRTKPEFVRNQFGGGAGGPMFDDRTFVYANVDELQERRGVTQIANVPSLMQRSSVPASRISNLAAQVLTLYPLPNLPGTSGNYLGQPTASETATQLDGRLDRRLSSTSELTMRYSHGNQDVFEPYAHGGSIVPGFGDYVTNVGHNAMAHYQATLGPRTFESLYVGFNRAFREVLPQNQSTDVGSLWNVSWLNVPPRDFGFPFIIVAGLSPIGDQTQTPISRYTTTVQIVDGLTLVRGRSVLKIGAEARNVRLNGALDYFARGQMTFSGAITGSGISDLLSGFPSFAIQAQFNNPQTLRTTSYNSYIQEDWKVRSNLTLNLGLRYEYNTPPTDPHDRMAILDLASAAVVNVGTHGISRSGTRPDRNNFAPRLGFAWTPAARVVVRGAYGVYYDAGMLVVNSSLYFNPPYFNVHAWFPTPSNPLTLENPFPINSTITPPPSPNTLSPDLTTPYLQDWNMTVERQFGGATTASVAYAGSKGTHLIRSRDLNQPQPAPGSVALRRPFPAFGGIFFIESGGNSNYQSLQASVQAPIRAPFFRNRSLHAFEVHRRRIGVPGNAAGQELSAEQPGLPRRACAIELRYAEPAYGGRRLPTALQPGGALYRNGAVRAAVHPVPAIRQQQYRQQRRRFWTGSTECHSQPETRRSHTRALVRYVRVCDSGALSFRECGKKHSDRARLRQSRSGTFAPVRDRREGDDDLRRAVLQCPEHYAFRPASGLRRFTCDIRPDIFGETASADSVRAAIELLKPAGVTRSRPVAIPGCYNVSRL